MAKNGTEFLDALEACLPDGIGDEEMAQTVRYRLCVPNLLLVFAVQSDIESIMRVWKLSSDYPDDLQLGRRDMLDAISSYAVAQCAKGLASVSPGFLQKDLSEFTIGMGTPYIRQVLWAMASVGAIRRKKAGSCFALYVPEEQSPSSRPVQ